MPPPVVTILGGGISGLSAAYYLSRSAPQIKIRLLEASDRVGGWIKSNHIKDNVLFEAGPRTLRPQGAGGALLLDMIKDLQLDQHLLSIPKTHSSARHRYIEYQGHINQLPSGVPDLLLNRPSIMNSVVGTILKEPFTTTSPSGGNDETIYDFVERRFNRHVALNLVGALAHGIYAGDCKQLSVQSTFPMLAACEQRYGSVVKGMLQGGVTLDTEKEQQLVSLCQSRNVTWHKEMQGASVIGLLPGLETLPKALHNYLTQQPNIDVLKNQSVTRLERSSPTTMTVTTNQGQYQSDHVISTLPSHRLDSILPNNTKLPHLTHNPNVSVAVVNLAYKKNECDTGLDGFGFLTPHRDAPCGHQVPGVLGVIFDSNSLGAQDKDNDVVRFTAMIGGSDWDLAFGDADGAGDDVPAQALVLAQKAMSKCLGVHATPVYHQAHILKQCLPQYLVDHRLRLRDLHSTMQQQTGHQLSVTGASYLGVSVPDCVKNSRLLVDDLLSVGILGDQSATVTGLEKSMINLW